MTSAMPARARPELAPSPAPSQGTVWAGRSSKALNLPENSRNARQTLARPPPPSRHSDGALRPRRSRRPRGRALGGARAPARPRARHRGRGGAFIRGGERAPRARARRSRAMALRGQGRATRGPSFLSADPSRRMHETRGVSRWQARATYGDAGRGPADGIGPRPRTTTSSRERTSRAPTRAEPRLTATRTTKVLPRRRRRRRRSHLRPPRASPGPGGVPSRTAMDMRARVDAFYASVAAKGPRRPVSPGAHRGRWEARAEVSRRREANSSDDLHAGRHEARAFFGDGGGKCDPVPWSERDERGGNRHAGRWEARGEWHDANVHLEMPNHGHYAPHVGRDAWEAGKYLKLPRGVHGPGRRTVWDPGLWERRAEWPRGAALEPKRRRDDPDPGPRGQAPIGPRNESRTLAGVWEDRAEWHRDSDGHAPRDVGPLGHVRCGARRHEGRWEARAEWGRGGCTETRTRDDEHEGRWEEKPRSAGRAAAARGVERPRRRRRAPPGSRRRTASTSATFATSSPRNARTSTPRGGNRSSSAAGETKTTLSAMKDAASSEDASLRFASSGRFAPRPTWAGTRRRGTSRATRREARSKPRRDRAASAARGRRREEEEAGGGGGGGGGTGGDGSAEAPARSRGGWRAWGPTSISAPADSREPGRRSRTRARPRRTLAYGERRGRRAGEPARPWGRVTWTGGGGRGAGSGAAAARGTMVR